MAAEYQVEVIVKDESDRPIADATVFFGPEPLPSELREYPFAGLVANCRYDQGRYLNRPLSTTGEHFLIVRSASRRTVYQRLIITSVPANTYGFTVRDADATHIFVEGTVTRTTTHPWTDSCYQGAIFSGIRQTGTGISLATLLITIKMYPINDVVIICGVHYEHPGAPWRGYFQTRWQELVREVWQGGGRVIDPGTVVAFFSCEEQSLFIYVKSRHGDYLTMQRYRKPVLASGFVPGQLYPFRKQLANINNSYSITEFYQHIANRGANRVRDVEVFSHAWMGGPILYDTYQRPQFANNRDARDPESDLDGRVKDFRSDAVFSGWSDVPAATAGSGRWRLWGCSIYPWLEAAMSAADHTRGRPRNTYDTGIFTHWDDVNRVLNGEHHTTQDICYYHTTRLLLGDAYAGALAARLAAPQGTASNRQVWAAVPGSWASFNGTRFQVQWDATPGTLRYFEQEPNIRPHFSRGRDLGRYVDFIPFQNLAQPTPPADITEYYILEQAPSASTDRYFRIIFYHAHPFSYHEVVEPCQPPVTIASQAVPDATAYSRPGRSGHLHVVRDSAGHTWRFLVLSVVGNTNEVEVVRLAA